MQAGHTGLDPGPEPDLEVLFTLECRFQGEKFLLTFEAAETTVADVKEQIWAVMNVRPDRQKLLGLALPGQRGKLAPDGSLLSELNLKERHAVTVMGTREEVVESLGAVESESRSLSDDLVDDFDFVPTEAPTLDDTNIRSQLDRIVSRVNINVISPMRPGKKLLVIDIDYTIFDMKAPLSEPGIMQYARRPYVIDFLAMVYPYYNIAVWSQTSWSWLEAKLTEMGILFSDHFNISFVCDKSAMLDITSLWTDGKPRKHHCKPLAFLWAKFPEYGPHNSVIVDDLSRNFALNPRNGVKVTAYKHCKRNAGTDKELYYVGRYLKAIGMRDDKRLDKYDHTRWKKDLAKVEAAAAGLRLGTGAQAEGGGADTGSGSGQ